MKATVKRVGRGQYQFVWAENGEVIKATNGKLTEPLFSKPLQGDKAYAEHVLAKYVKLAKQEGVQLI